jgi:hypothetical protein
VTTPRKRGFQVRTLYYYYYYDYYFGRKPCSFVCLFVRELEATIQKGEDRQVQLSVALAQLAERKEQVRRIELELQTAREEVRLLGQRVTDFEERSADSVHGKAWFIVPLIFLVLQLFIAIYVLELVSFETFF